jgi:hypothetical protein
VCVVLGVVVCVVWTVGCMPVVGASVGRPVPCTCAAEAVQSQDIRGKPHPASSGCRRSRCWCRCCRCSGWQRGCRCQARSHRQGCRQSGCWRGHRWWRRWCWCSGCRA